MLLFLALHEPGKFLLEFLRTQPAPHLQVLSLAFAIVAWSVLAGRRAVAMTFSTPSAGAGGRRLRCSRTPQGARRGE